MPQTVTPVQVISPRCKVTAFFHSWCGSIRANEGERGSKENLFTDSSFYLCQTKDLYANCPGNECNANTASAAKLRTIFARDAGQLGRFMALHGPAGVFSRVLPFICDGFRGFHCGVRQDAGADEMQGLTRREIRRDAEPNEMWDLTRREIRWDAESNETREPTKCRIRRDTGSNGAEVEQNAGSDEPRGQARREICKHG